MSLKAAFIQPMPMKTIQRLQNRRPQKSSKFAKMAKKYKTGRKPPDTRPRWKEPIPPARADKETTAGQDNASTMK